MYDSILVPLDGSQHAESALPTAIRLAHASQARLELVSVDIALLIPEAGDAGVALAVAQAEARALPCRVCFWVV